MFTRQRPQGAGTSTPATHSGAYNFIDAIRAAGLEPPATIEPGRIHRFPGAGKGPRNNAGWCLLFDDCLGGCFGDWSSDFSTIWQAQRRRQFSRSELEAFSRRVNAAKAQTEVERKLRYVAVAKKAAAIWRDAIAAPQDHTYLQAKRIPPCGAHFLVDGCEHVALDGCLLVIPVHDVNGQIYSLQFISAQGEKRFLQGGALRGRGYLIGELPDRRSRDDVLLCEGFATGASLHLDTAAPVMCALSAGNLLSLGRELRCRLPRAAIIVAADNDARTQAATGHNPGVKKGQEAARAIAARCVWPREPGDFNDVWRRCHEDA